MLPEKRLLTPDDMKLWEESPTRAHFTKFIIDLAESVKGHENSQYKEPISESINSMMNLLSQIKDITQKHPVIKDADSSRFGKVEFRDFYDEVSRNSRKILRSEFPSLTDEQLEQLSIYLDESWGNKRRIDYGSGHELNFMCLLYGLYSYGIFNLSNDSTNLVLKVL